jgi:selenocysteine lyase/cysteine desulfurase
MAEQRERFGAIFDAPAGYLDTPRLGVAPRHVAAALTGAVGDWAAGNHEQLTGDEASDRARRAFAELAGVPVASVALGFSVSTMVGLIASALPSGTRVLVAEDEYSSVTLPFVAQSGRGVVVDPAPLAELALRSSSYDLVAVSVVQSRDGTIVDLPALRAARAASTCRVLLDVTQAAGWLPLQLDWADAVVCSAYKWLLAPRGVGWMAARDDFRDTILPAFANWRANRAGDQTMYGARLDLHEDARRFDVSPPGLTLIAAAESMEWLASLDQAAVREHCAGLADRLRETLALEPAGSAIVAVPYARDGEALRREGVAASVRDGRARFGFHIFNTVADVDTAVRALARVN